MCLQHEDCSVDIKPNNFCQENTISREAETSATGILESFPTSSEKDPKERMEDVRKQLLQQYIEVTVEPGELLYLPASWFHEVISSSYSSAAVLEEGMTHQRCDPGHMAFSYWFYPPNTPSATFTSPYVDEYWSSRYRHILETMDMDRKKELLEQLQIAGGDPVANILQLLKPEFHRHYWESTGDFRK